MRVKLQLERERLIEPYLLPGDEVIDYSNMPEHVFESYLNGIKERWKKADPELLTVYKKANDLTYEQFSIWFNKSFTLKKKLNG